MKTGDMSENSLAMDHHNNQIHVSLVEINFDHFQASGKCSKAFAKITWKTGNLWLINQLLNLTVWIQEISTGITITPSWVIARQIKLGNFKEFGFKGDMKALLS